MSSCTFQEKAFAAGSRRFLMWSPQARADLPFSTPMVCRRCRPQQPHASSAWQVIKERWPAWLIRKKAGVPAKHGPRPAHASTTVAALLRCGALHAGFTRLRCPDCHHEYRSPSPANSAACAAEVPHHRHLALTIPRLLRGHFAGRPDLPISPARANGVQSVRGIGGGQRTTRRSSLPCISWRDRLRPVREHATG